MAASKEDMIEKLRRIIYRKGKGPGIPDDWFEAPCPEK